MRFRTEYGTLWAIEDGKITRFSEIPIARLPDMLIVDEPLREQGEVTVGQRFQFKLFHISGWFRTSPVTEILP